MSTSSMPVIDPRRLHHRRSLLSRARPSFDAVSDRIYPVSSPPRRPDCRRADHHTGRRSRRELLPVVVYLGSGLKLDERRSRDQRFDMICRNLFEHDLGVFYGFVGAVEDAANQGSYYEPIAGTLDLA
jgi:hypothetical protein